MSEYLKSAIFLVFLVIVQKTLIWLVALTHYEITPDILLIGLVLLGIRKGKIAGSVGGFLSGLLLDFMSFSFLGLMALSKATAGFVSGYFNNENKIERYTKSYIFIIIVFTCSILNNLIYFIFYFQGMSLSFFEIVIKYILPTGIYTAVFSVIPVIFNRRKNIFT
jgi:rod shape-determining protein MreD